MDVVVVPGVQEPPQHSECSLSGEFFSPEKGCSCSLLSGSFQLDADGNVLLCCLMGQERERRLIYGKNLFFEVIPYLAQIGAAQAFQALSSAARGAERRLDAYVDCGECKKHLRVRIVRDTSCCWLQLVVL